MPFRALIGLLVPLLFSLHAWADNIQLNPGHPTRYTVVKGDTLWDISGKFLQKPWQWPQIWHNNPQIENPHLIYPGDVITLTIVDGQPRLSVSRNNGVLKLSPHIRETEHQDAIKVIPIDAIAAYLTSPKVVGKDDLDNAPYIIDFAGEYLVAAAGDRVYVRSITEPKHLAYTIYRQGETYKNPETGEILGYEAKYIADTTLQRPGDPATLLITKSKSEIRIGDRLMPNQEGQVALNYFPRAPKSMISGSIISVLNGVSQIGRHDIVIVDKGSRDGLKAGHVLDIYQRGDIVRDKYSGIVNETVTLPEELAGTLMIFRTFDRVSYALVMEATAAIHVLDKIKTPLNTSNEQDPKYWLALLRTPGVGPRTFLRILAVCTPEQLFTQARHLPDELNLTRRSIDFIKNPDWRSIDQDLNWLAQPDNHLLTCDDPAYPKQLQEIPDAPPVLFVRGSIDLLSRPPDRHRRQPQPFQPGQTDRAGLCRYAGRLRFRHYQRPGAGYRCGKPHRCTAQRWPDHCRSRNRPGQNLSRPTQATGAGNRRKRRDHFRISTWHDGQSRPLSQAQSDHQRLVHWSAGRRSGQAERFADHGASGPGTEPGSLRHPGIHPQPAGPGLQRADPGRRQAGRNNARHS